MAKVPKNEVTEITLKEGAMEKDPEASRGKGNHSAATESRSEVIENHSEGSLLQAEEADSIQQRRVSTRRTSTTSVMRRKAESTE